MVDALRHRGPDGDGVRRIGPVTLAHTRLAIIDVAGGDQPLVSEDGQVTLIANGEIYNHRELRASLEQRGHRFATGSDCEAIVHAYEEHGLDCVRRLNGIFAFALWDAARGRLVAARDQFGVKPLYWCSDGTRTAVASEIGALLQAGLATAGARPHGARPLPRLPLRPRPAHAVQGRQQAAGRLAAGRRGARRAPDRELARRPRRAPPRRPRRGARRPARRALHRRRRAPDDVRRPVRRLPVGRGRLGRRRGGDGEALAGSRPAPSRSASPATATCSTSARPPPRAPA